MSDATHTPVPKPAKRRGSGLAAASLFSGAGSLFLLPLVSLPYLALPAIVCGHWARHRLAQNQRRAADSWFALAGLIMAYLSAAIVIWLGRPVVSAIEQARRINCAGNLKAIDLTCKMYASDYGDAYPPDWRTLADNKYLDAPKIWICPSTDSTPATNSGQLTDPKHCDYVYFGLGQKDPYPAGAKIVLAADRTGNHRGFWNVAFQDGHIASLTARAGTDFATAVRAKGWILPGAAQNP